MPSALKPLGQVQLSTSGTPTTIYTPPAGATPNAQTIVKSLWVANTDTVAREVTVRYGTGSLTAANDLLPGVTIDPKTTFLLDADILAIIAAGAKLEGFSDSANKITVTAFGEEIM